MYKCGVRTIDDETVNKTQSSRFVHINFFWLLSSIKPPHKATLTIL